MVRNTIQIYIKLQHSLQLLVLYLFTIGKHCSCKPCITEQLICANLEKHVPHLGISVTFSAPRIWYTKWKCRHLDAIMLFSRSCIGVCGSSGSFLCHFNVFALVAMTGMTVALEIYFHQFTR